MHKELRKEHKNPSKISLYSSYPYTKEIKLKIDSKRYKEKVKILLILEYP